MSTSRITKYASVFNIGLQNTFVYRWNYFLRALFGLIPLAGTVFLWSAVFKERGGGLHGYDYGSMIYYYLLTFWSATWSSQQKTNFKSQPTFGKARSMRCSRSR